MPAGSSAVVTVGVAMAVGQGRCLCGHGHARSYGVCCARGRREVAVAEAVDARGMAFGGDWGT